MLIRYTGDNIEDVRKALANLKPNNAIRAEKLEGMARFDMVWGDGQVSEGRWFVREGDYLDSVTGATLDGSKQVVDVAETFGIGVPDVDSE